MTFSHVVIALSIVSGIIILFYIIVRIAFGKKSVITSTVKNSFGEIEADQYYFLPTASLIIKATATVVVTKDKTTDCVTDAKLLSIDFENEVKIEPDSKDLITITYNADAFSNDELQIKTDDNSLLETISSISEDRITNIIAKVAEAPAIILADHPVGFLREELDEKEIADIFTETRQYIKEFIINAEDTTANEFDREWKINIDGQTENDPQIVNASFLIVKENPELRLSLGNDKKYGGFFTRPLKNITRKVHLADQLEKTETKFEIQSTAKFNTIIPDHSILLKIPLNRRYFVKSTETPKFSKGLLIENYFQKPSEFEAALSIPINILKAIVSIPAQLLHFKITRNNLEAEYEKSIQDLLKAQQETKNRQQLVIDNNKAQLAKLQKKIDEVAIILKRPSAEQQQEVRPQLGKLPASEDDKLVDRELDFIAEIAFADDLTFPLAHNWGGILPESAWEDYDNKNQKTCVPAAAAHLITCWTSNTSPSVVIYSLTDVLDALEVVAPLHDTNNGCKMIDFMAYWKKSPGFRTDILDRFRKFKTGDSQMLKKVIYFFGGCLIGLLLPLSAGMTGTWEFPSGKTDSDEINSWGGHTVCVVGYDKNYFIVISWGNVIRMSNSFYEKYNDESYVALSNHWTFPNDKSPTIAQLGFEALNNLMNTFPLA